MGRKRVDPDKRKRLDPQQRKAQLLDAAYEQASRDGLAKVNRLTVGEACGVTDGLVSRYFGTVRGLHDAVAAKAVLAENVDIIADCLEMGWPDAAFPDALAQKAREALATA